MGKSNESSTKEKRCHHPSYCPKARMKGNVLGQILFGYSLSADPSARLSDEALGFLVPALPGFTGFLKAFMGVIVWSIINLPLKE